MVTRNPKTKLFQFEEKDSPTIRQEIVLANRKILYAKRYTALLDKKKKQGR